MDAQQQHDLNLRRKLRLKGSREKLESLLEKRKDTSPERLESDEYNWVGALLKEHPNLTIEEVDEMAKAFGF